MVRRMKMCAKGTTDLQEEEEREGGGGLQPVCCCGKQNATPDEPEKAARSVRGRRQLVAPNRSSRDKREWEKAVAAAELEGASIGLKCVQMADRASEVGQAWRVYEKRREEVACVWTLVRRFKGFENRNEKRVSTGSEWVDEAAGVR